MKVLIASDKFKGSMTAPEACEAIRSGVLASGDHEVRCVPIADGGDGMARAITAAKSGEWKELEVSDALGRNIVAGFGLINDGRTAVVEMAEASGLWRVENRPLNPTAASTFGTGKIMRFTAESGVEDILLGIGGSATNDGGTGMAQALGYRFLDDSGIEIREIPEKLMEVRSIESPADIDQFPAITVACDVTNPLLGKDGCTQVYGPQKGISAAELSAQETRLEHLVSLLGEEGVNASLQEGSGAAGGLGFGCLSFLNAQLIPGFDLVAKVLDLNAHVEWADHVITGEGKIDRQSLQGKAPVGVAGIARNFGKDTTAFCGVCGDGDFSEFFDRVIELDRGDRDIEQSMKDGFELLKSAALRAL